ncbi:uncharacterized protein BYT42DRAFT_543383 [Radiomyces spectabilis]|uniref:uncharacterized protein n=1 Tax=Radiomyces spectabilis TaxID=64574 RepID=UPI00221F63AD|nr:uncharacterized protein BYT42DRAFT_543383 [Radiomyces spectabilis]KAI8388004.1 hypothetical protein BYT42DRAFT_543383 [Radiomyces spectabilis]
MSNKNRLTLGQASCLVLGLPPTPENRKSSKEWFKSSPLAVTFKDDDNPLEPIAIGKAVKQQNVFRFHDYPETPSTSRENSPEPESESSGSSTEEEEAAAFNMHSVVNQLKAYISLEEPVNPELFDKKFVTSDVIKDIITHHFHVQVTTETVSHWIGRDGWLGSTTRHRINGKVERGRWAYVMKTKFQDYIQRDRVSSHKKYLKYLKKAGADLVTVGYARKSPGKESCAVRVRCLQLMINKLRTRYRCAKIFVSPSCYAYDRFDERDLKDEPDIINNLKFIKGTMQDLIVRLNTKQQPIRLVILDYAGLSTNVSDIHHFIK